VCLCSALHHNNCLYIAYHVIVIDKTFRQKLMRDGGTAASSKEHELTLAELVPKMRRIGNDSFSEHLDTRKAQLRHLLSSANGTHTSASLGIPSLSSNPAAEIFYCYLLNYSYESFC